MDEVGTVAGQGGPYCSPGEVYIGKESPAPERTLVQFISTSAAFHGMKKQPLRSLESDLRKVFVNNRPPRGPGRQGPQPRRLPGRCEDLQGAAGGLHDRGHALNHALQQHAGAQPLQVGFTVDLTVFDGVGCIV